MNDKVYFTKVDKKGKYVFGQNFKKVRPVESNEYFLNPHKGIATFQRFNGDPLFKGEYWCESGPEKFSFKRNKVQVVKGYVPSTVSFCRWFWSVLEPEEGNFNWKFIEGALKQAELNKQSLEVRLMAFGMNNDLTPKWFQKICPHFIHQNLYVEPEHDHPLYFKYWSRVIREFAKRFAGHPNLDVLDIAFHGPFGENWDEKISNATVEKFMDVYFKCVPQHKLVVNFHGYQLPYGSKLGMGWRADCFGDMRNAGNGIMPDGLGWNHMYDFYPKSVAEAGAGENWKVGPVLMETCWNPVWWYNRKMPIEFLEWCHKQYLKYHASVFMPKSSLLPEKYMKSFMELAKQLGYRFVLRQFQFDRKLKDNSFKYEMWVENVGVAPMYRGLYELAFRFTQGKRSAIVRSKEDIRAWMPGDAYITEKLKVPGNFSRGQVMIETALLDKETNMPKVWFAVEGYKKDGWLPLDTIEVDK